MKKRAASFGVDDVYGYLFASHGYVAYRCAENVVVILLVIFLRSVLILISCACGNVLLDTLFGNAVQIALSCIAGVVPVAFLMPARKRVMVYVRFWQPR